MLSSLRSPFALAVLLLLLACIIDTAPNPSEEPTPRADGRCKCGRKALTEMDPLELTDSEGAKLKLLQDKELLGEGGYSEVFHVYLESSGGEAKHMCAALKYTIVGKDEESEQSQKMRSNERAQNNEWMILDGYKRNVLDKDPPGTTRRIIQLYHKGRVHSAEKRQTLLFSMMELGDGGDYFDFLDKEGRKFRENPLTDASLGVILREIVDALSDLQEGIIHSDIKPENLIYASGQLKVIDFNGSQLIKEEKGDRANSKQAFENIVFTQKYESPECVNTREDANGKEINDMSTKTDIWAFGMVMYDAILFDPRYFKFTATFSKENNANRFMEGITRFYRKMGEVDDIEKFIGNEWQKNFVILEFILTLRKDLPRMFHLITANLTYDHTKRPSTFGIQQFLKKLCRFPTQGQRKRVQLATNLHLSLLLSIANKAIAQCNETLKQLGANEPRNKKKQGKKGAQAETSAHNVAKANKWNSKKAQLQRIKKLAELAETDPVDMSLPLCATQAIPRKIARRDRDHESSRERGSSSGKGRSARDSKGKKSAETSSASKKKDKSRGSSASHSGSRSSGSRGSRSSGSRSSRSGSAKTSSHTSHGSRGDAKRKDTKHGAKGTREVKGKEKASSHRSSGGSKGKDVEKHTQKKSTNAAGDSKQDARKKERTHKSSSRSISQRSGSGSKSRSKSGSRSGSKSRSKSTSRSGSRSGSISNPAKHDKVKRRKTSGHKKDEAGTWPSSHRKTEGKSSRKATSH